MAAKKKLFEDSPKPHIQCAADPNCRYPGLMWVSGLNPNQRICVVHYGRHPERHYDDMPQKMINVQAKPVAGG